MTFSLYPKHEFACPNIGHCPHLGGAALGTLVQIANDSDESHLLLVQSIRTLEQRNSELLEQNGKLQAQLAQAKLELKLERQNKFATNQQRHADAEATLEVAGEPPGEKQSKKRGAPVGHPGWFRVTPTEYDWAVAVSAPRRCPDCQGGTRTLDGTEPSEHLQEDIIEGVYRVVLYRHVAW